MKKLSLLLITGLVYALNGDELAQQMANRKKPTDSKVDLLMTLTNKKGKARSSSLRSIIKDDGAKQIIWFLSPADDKGVSFLKIEHDEKDDEMRMWLPAFKKIRRISTNKRSDSFMGSDLSYEDMSTRQIDEYTFKIVGQEMYDSIFCYLLESIPKENIRTEYNHHVAWIDTSLFLPMKEQSYDKLGKLLKKKKFTYSVINDYHVLTEIQVINIQKNHSTNLKFENIELNTGVGDKLFHQRNLKRLPK